MKQKLLAILLAASVAVSMALPAAAQSADSRLADVTTSVKAVLDLNTEDYTDFYGDLDENILAPSWYLEWFGQNSSLTVSATEEGKILSYYLREDLDAERSGSYAPSFPDGDRDSAQSSAEAFLNKVLTAGESYTIKDQGQDRLNASTYRFRGEILLNGLSAGLSYSISVRCSDNEVTDFYRDDLNGQVMGGIPSAKASVSAEKARAALRDTLSLKLEYVLPEDGGKRAILRYLPEYGDDYYYVDAATGKLVNLTELSRDLEMGAAGGSNSAADKEAAEAPSASAPTLSDAEQAGVKLLEGVLDRDALDAKVCAISALGLDAYSLSTVNYTVPRTDADDETVTAALVYGRQVDGSSWRRTVTVNARTGELIRVYSSAWMKEQTVARPVNMDQAQKIAAAFLTDRCSAQFVKTDLYSSYDALDNDYRVSHAFTFAQKEHGYFFPGNTITVSVDATDGSISAYEKRFDDGVTFDTPDGILSPEQALDAWLDTYAVKLSYIHVPAAIDYSHPNYKELMDYGISYLYKLVLGYGLGREDYFLGIDAKNGKPVAPVWAAEPSGMVYSDISGHWAQEKIEALGRYGVGYYGGRFEPNRALTQLDLLALLASTEGYLYIPEEDDAADRLYDFASGLGIIKKEERKDDMLLSRGETVKLILDAVGYSHVAQLEGIFRTHFSDEGNIPAEYLGYAALAQGLGMVSGTEGGRFQYDAGATRAQAAVMLHNLMAR